MRTQLCLLVLVLAVGAVQAETDSKLVGKWGNANEKSPVKLTVEFMKDGKMSITIEMKVTKKDAGKAEIEKTVEKGVYTVEGKKLTITLKRDGKEDKKTFTITTLDDKTLITDDGKRKTEFRRK